MYNNIHPYAIIAGLVSLIGLFLVLRHPLFALFGAVSIFYLVDLGIKIASKSER